MGTLRRDDEHSGSTAMRRLVMNDDATAGRTFCRDDERSCAPNEATRLNVMRANSATTAAERDAKCEAMERPGNAMTNAAEQAPRFR
jgi:hypothetical protein